MPPKCLLPASSGGGFDDEGINSSSSSGAALPHQHECGAVGGQTPKPKAGDRAGVKRVAACVSGQARSLPVAFMSWRQTIFRLLRAGGEFELDLFLVIANSSSLLHWLHFINRLRVVDLVVTEPTAFYNKTARVADGWTVQSRDGRVHFNLARFPWWREHKYGVVLMQHYQLGVCRRTIQDHEERSGFRYERVARLRTDIVFSGVLVEGWVARPKGGPVARAPGTPMADSLSIAAAAARRTLEKYLDCVARGDVDEEGRGRQRQCLSLIEAERARLIRDCGAHLRKLATAGRHWLTATDLFMFGSRDVVVDGFFRGIHLLEQARASGRHTLMVHVTDAWQAMSSHLLQETFPNTSDAGPCAVAIDGMDILRAAGPPVGRFFLQLAESATQLTPCLRRGLDAAVCLRAIAHDLFALPAPELSRDCFGLRHDLWRVAPKSSCSPGEIADDLARAHATRFGERLVGDLSNWAHGRMSSNANRLWSGSERTHSVRDGFQ